MHGDDDTAVPSRTSDKLAEVVRETQPQTTLRYDLVPGQDHAFDLDESTWASFYTEAMDFVKVGWLN